MEKKEERLIAEIRALYGELIEEEKERDVFVGKKLRTIYPNKDVYINKAKELYEKALELEKLDSRYSAFHLNEVMSDEVYMVGKHKYDYDGLIPKSDNIKELQKWMKKATYHIKLFYYDVLGDIKTE